MPPLRLLVTGPPGCGKTTLCTGVRDRLQGRSLPASGSSPKRSAAAPQFGLLKYFDKLPFLLFGFLTHERRNSAGKRVAFDLVSLDGSQQACLASVEGPATGRRVGQYHVQTDGWERLACDILDEALGASGRTRAVIFDEIGKMELSSEGYVRRVESLLNSTDATLHVLGTVALKGPGLIEASKGLPGVEVIELSNAARDRQQVEIAECFIEALSGEAVSPAPSAALSSKLPPEAGDIGLAGEASTASKAPAAAAAVPRATFDIPPKGEFSSVYLAEPAANFASLNAGDYLLYVGGKAINRAFAEAMEDCGQTPKKRYEVLHKALMAKAGRRGARGKLAWLAEEDVPPGAFADTIAFCGLLPEGMERLEPVGLSSIAVFPASRRPCGSERNVAMVYTIGPNCGGVRKVKGPGQSMTKAEFLEVMEAVGHSVSSAVAQYNSAAGSRGLPSIEIFRICLVSGGVYKHPGATKLEVASSLVQGLVAGSSEGSPTLDFAWDDDVFQIAWRGLGLLGAGSKSGVEPGDQAEPVERRVEPRVERRVDPANGRTYTLAELERFYTGSYSKEETWRYWEETCQRVEASPHGSAAGAGSPEAGRGARGRWRHAK